MRVKSQDVLFFLDYELQVYLFKIMFLGAEFNKLERSLNFLSPV